MNALFKSLLLLLILYWSYWLLFTNPPWVFLDGVNLIFHEAGHVIFLFLGQFMRVLGGSLLQCLIPFGIGLYFLYTKQFFSANFCLFWLGDNLINVSAYISDSRAIILPLLGGDPSGHDWHWILGTLNLLQQDTLIGGFVWWIGCFCLLAAIGIGVYLIILDFVAEHSESVGVE